MDGFSMKTSFGEATFEMVQVDQIQFGNPDSVTTLDQTKLTGKIRLDELPLKLTAANATGDRELKLSRDLLSSLVTDLGAPEFLPGKIVDGSASNRMSYHLRLPGGYDTESGAPALVLLHGSNMSSQAYVNTVVTAWPKLAADFILIGINGEHRVPNRPADNPAFNYSGVNFVGKSKYKGFPGTDRESPALVPEVIAELKDRLKNGKLFVGGHSQGGFVTYSIFMNYPELVAGVFPISAGPWLQCEPTAYDNPDVRNAQRRVAVAIVHGENDSTVPFKQGRAAFESFDDDGFPTLHFFTDKEAGHMFARLPVERAVRWLEQMASEDAESLVRFAQDRTQAGEFRDATAAIARARTLDLEKKLEAKLAALDREIDDHAAPHAARLPGQIAGGQDDAWVQDFIAFRAQFQFAAAAQPAIEAYRKLRAQHEQPATKLWNDARADFQAGRQNQGYDKYNEIVKKYFASSWYRYAKPAVVDRSAQKK
jgi:predicted esterase/Arc/MetJ-type ribon-helix-helix transcriptional regulator